ncbi:MAG: hypothetical protein INR64_13230, partial [Caulobacteraceae bacterium]|nr:hypothetical protein [Caulobacter sp.]
MTAVSTDLDPPPAAHRARANGWTAQRMGAAAWALAQAALLGALLLCLGAGGGRCALALAVAALPGLLGAAGPRGREWNALHLAAWTVAAGLAVALSGGPAGPLAAYLLTPALAACALRLGAGWAVGSTAFAAPGAALAAWPAGLPPLAGG